MSTQTEFVIPQEEAIEPGDHYLNHKFGLASWLLTKDHKRIAILYLISISFFFTLGGLMAVLIRIELATPEGDLVQPDIYNRLFTMHGVLMIFFFLIPGIPSVLGNFLIPLMIGAKDLAFPKINLLSWYLYVAGSLFTFYALISGGIDTGWTFYAPLSTSYTNTHVIAVGLGVFIAGFSSILTGLNFIVTIHRMRAPGMTWFRLPLFVWSLRDEPDSDSGHSGHRDHDLVTGGRAPAARRDLRPQVGRRPGALSALLLVLLAPGRLHHDPSGDGRDQRAHCRLHA